MSIEINAKVNRQNAIFMSGESFIVSVSLRNTDETKPNSLAWGCVQLHCNQILLRSVDETKKDSETQKQSEKTSVPVRGKQSIYSSAPAIIFCDARFKACEAVQFDHTLTLPLYMPPSFKGYFLKYNWYVSIAVQHVDAPIKVLHLPIKVINVTVDVSSEIMSLSDENRKETDNPFLLREYQKPSIVDLVSNKLEEMISMQSLRIFEIKSANCVFAVITMFKHFYKLGDDICGRISFPQNTNLISCLQVLVRVETVEVNLSGSKREENISYQFTEHFFTAFIRETHFRVPIPLTAVPAFSTKDVQLKWRLHFEFVTSAKKPIKFNVMEFQNEETPNLEADDAEELTKLETDLRIETMAWDAYISVHSCNPHNAGLVANVPSSSISLIV